MKRCFTTYLLGLYACALIPLPLQAADDRETILARPRKVMDAYNQDGMPDAISEAEFIRWKKAQAKAAHEKADLNKDGVVSLDEALATAEAKAEEELIPYVSHQPEGEPRVVTTEGMNLYFTKNDPEFAAEAKKKWKELLLEDYPALRGLKIRQSLLQSPDKATSPARMSWTWDNVASDSFYTFDGALSYEIPLDDNLYLAPTVEAHTSNQASNERDLLMFALPLEYGILTSGWVDAHYIKGMASYNMDSRQDLETLDASLLYSFDIPDLGIGVVKSLRGGERYPQFVWRPWIGVDYGSVNKTGGVPDLAAESSYLRLRADVDATLWLADFFAINGRYAHVTYLNGLERSHNYAEISAILYLDESQVFSMGATYRRGQPTPQFREVDSITIWTGIKF